MNLKVVQKEVERVFIKWVRFVSMIYNVNFSSWIEEDIGSSKKMMNL